MKLQFCMENPSTGALKAQRYMSGMLKYATTVDYCRYQTLEDGEWVKYAFRKPTMLCSNVPDIATINKRCNCPNFRHESSIIGDKARGRRFNHGGGRSPNLAAKHAIPTELHLEVLKRALQAEPESTWVLDAFSGTQSLKRANCRPTVMRKLCAMSTARATFSCLLCPQSISFCLAWSANFLIFWIYLAIYFLYIPVDYSQLYFFVYLEYLNI